MATKSGNADIVVGPIGRAQEVTSDVNKLRNMLAEEPFRVHFFQAVRLLQKIEKDRGPVGYFTTPEGETIRFRSLATLTFPASEIFDLQTADDLQTGPMKMTVQFMGLCAAVAIMPTPYTELMMARTKLKDHAMEDFFNIFNHRMISFFYRGWEKYRFYIEYEKNGRDKISARLFDLLGLGTLGLQGRGELSDEAYLHYVGLLGRHVRTASSLQKVLADYFGVNVRIEQFAGTWRKLKTENQTCFTGRGGVSERLGRGVVAGDEVWDHHGRIRVKMGPMQLDRYLEFLPGQAAYRQLVEWVRFYSNGNYEAEIQLLLIGADAPPCELGVDGKTQPQLGLVSWLKTRPILRDPGDATYLIQ